MPGDFLRRSPQLTMLQFHAFRDSRPEEEKWELIDGVPILPDRPTIMHQRIARAWPDVTVMDAAIKLRQVYVRRFYFVGEVLSENDKKDVLEAKLRYYQTTSTIAASCSCVRTVSALFNTIASLKEDGAGSHSPSQAPSSTCQTSAP